MRRKILGFIIFLVLTSTFTSVVSSVPNLPDNMKKTGHEILNFNNYQLSQYKNSFNLPYDFLINIIQQMTETRYLEYLENITAFGPRYTGTPACQQAGDYIYNEFQSMGLDVRYHDWNYQGYQDKNIEATLYGVNETSDEIYIICAHHDTVSNCPGADDDASGVATVLAAAYILRKYEFHHTIRFVTFSGEEQWMLGSHEYAREAYENGENIIAVLNVDMIGFAINNYHGSNIKVHHNDESLWLTDFTDNLAEQYYDYINLDVIPSGYAPSDQLYFWEYGYDGLFYHEFLFNYYYHTPQDIIENMNISYATKCSKLVLLTLSLLADIANYPPETPSIDGPTLGAEDVEYIYTFITNDPDDQDVYYYIEWGDGDVEDWIGPFESGEEAIVSHMWISPGEYELRAKAKDINDLESGWSDVYSVSIIENEPPNKPDINGETKGNAGIEYEYTFVTTDPDWDKVYYYIDWGDGNIVEWDGPYKSNEEVKISHCWNSTSTYKIRVKAKDIYNAEGNWAELEVSIPRSKESYRLNWLNMLLRNFPLFQKMLFYFIIK